MKGKIMSRIVKRVEMDVQTILNGAPTCMVGHSIYAYESVYIATFHVGKKEYTINAVFDLDTGIKELVICDSLDTIINKIG